MAVVSSDSAAISREGISALLIVANKIKQALPIDRKPRRLQSLQKLLDRGPTFAIKRDTGNIRLMPQGASNETAASRSLVWLHVTNGGLNDVAVGSPVAA
jgi:hypothetical protein